MNLVEKIEKQVYNDDKSLPYYTISAKVFDMEMGMASDKGGDVVFSPQIRPVDNPAFNLIIYPITESDLAG